MRTRSHLTATLLLALATMTGVRAQVVGVTVQLDTNVVAVGQSTTLRVYAQVLPPFRANAERIFSWYVDVINTNGAVAGANYADLLKPVADKDPQTSSNGFNSAANRIGIYDTFLNLPGAGTNPPVELLHVPVTGLTTGQTRFAVRAGTGVPSLSQDFIVAPLDGGEMMTGGDYGAASVNLTVIPGVSNVTNCLTITHTNLPGGVNRVMLQYCLLSGYDHFVEFRDQLVGGAGWQTFLGGPHNSGVYGDTNNVPVRFYRIRAVPAGSSLAPFRVNIARFSASQVRLTYPVTAGYNYTIEVRNNIMGGSWLPLAGGPHNFGDVIITSTGGPVFYRVRASQ